MTDPIRSHHSVAIPGTPEGDAMVLQHEMRGSAAALRAGRGSIDRADALLRQASALAMNLPPAEQAALSAVGAELATARDERARGASHDHDVQVPPSTRSRGGGPGTHLDRRLRGALRSLPAEPRAVAQHLSHRLLGAGRARNVRALGAMTPGHLEAAMDQASVGDAQRGMVRDAVAGILGHAFHREVVATAERAFTRAARSLGRVSRGGPPFNRYVDRLVGSADTYRMLQTLERGGAAEDGEALRHLIERTHVDPSLRPALIGEIRATARRAVRAVGRELSRCHHETFETGALLNNRGGRAYASFPSAIPRAAQRLGLPAERAEHMRDGHAEGETLLERAAAAHMQASAEVRRQAQISALAVGVAVAVLTGGTVGFSLAGLVGGTVAEAPEVLGAVSTARSLNRAAAVGLASGQEAEAANREAQVTIGVAAAGAAMEGAGVLADARRIARGRAVHAAAGAAGLGEAAATRAPGVINQARHLADH